jgi:hypothetical protein
VTPIGKGSRFLVLSGDYRGREGTVGDVVRDCPGLWWLDLGEGAEIVISQDEADGPRFKRLGDAPAEVDPLFVEIEAKLNTLDLRDEGVESDTIDAMHRGAFVEIAARAIAGIRAIDRR